MGQEQQQSAAVKIDPARAAGIVRNIEQLGSDATLAMEAMSESLMAAAVQIIGKIAVSPWQIVEADWTARIVCADWKMARGVGTGDAWLELAEISKDEEEGFSWISVAVGAGPTRLGIELVFRRGLQEWAEAVISESPLTEPLLKRGMIRTENLRLFFPIQIEAEALAQGFAANNLDKALIPVSEVVKDAIAAKAELDRLIGEVRSLAMRK